MAVREDGAEASDDDDEEQRSDEEVGGDEEGFAGVSNAAQTSAPTPAEMPTATLRM
jgi:hypothetical protein